VSSPRPTATKWGESLSDLSKFAFFEDHYLFVLEIEEIEVVNFTVVSLEQGFYVLLKFS
jgi:hypothetical protein